MGDIIENGQQTERMVCHPLPLKLEAVLECKLDHTRIVANR